MYNLVHIILILKDYTNPVTFLTSKNELKPKIAKRIINASTEHYALLPLNNSQSELRAETIKICKTLTRPLETYTAESWTMNKDTAKQFAALKEKFVEQCLWELN
jgi:hypothetical protein